MIRGQEFLLLFLIVLLLFGAARLPKLARSLREAKDEFNKGQAVSDVPEAHTANPEPAPGSRTEAPPPTDEKPPGTQVDPASKGVPGSMTEPAPARENEKANEEA